MTEVGKYEVGTNLNYILPSIGFSNAKAGVIENDGSLTENTSGVNYASSIADPGFVPSFYGSANLWKELYIGAGFTPGWSSAVEYPDPWVGENIIISSQLSSMVLDLALAYKFFDTISISAGLQATSGVFKIVQEVNSQGQIHTDLSGFAFGYTVSLLYQSKNNFTAGISLRSQVNNQNEGSMTVKVEGNDDVEIDDVSTDFKTPLVVNFGANFIVSKRVQAYTNVSFTQWSIYETLSVNVDDQYKSDVEQDWKDSWFFSVGADLEVVGPYFARIGFGLEQGAPDYIRSPTTPDTDRFIASIGVGATFEKLKLDLSFSRYYMQDVHMEYEAGSTFYEGDYNLALYNFGVALSYSI